MKRRSKIIGIIVITLLLISSGVVLARYSSGHSQAVKDLIQKSRTNMVYIPGGTYTMGPSNPDWQAGNTYPPHKVTLTSFYFSKYNVSYGEYDAYTQAIWKPYIQKEYRKPWDFFRDAVHPVNNITWSQANDYCQWLRKETSLPYDLPTEAQWEYVGRDLGKKNWAFATNNGRQELGKNFPSNDQFKHQKGNDGDLLPLPVGSIPCTPMGICGMNGEVVQWLKDWYAGDYYAHSPINDPQGPASGTTKTVRGGGAEGNPSFNHNFGRAGIDPSKGWAGFRCVINSSLPPEKLGAYADNQ